MLKIRTALALLLVAVFVFSGTFAGAQISRLAALAEAYPQNPDVLNSYGIELAGAGDLMGAISTWRHALDYDRNNVHLYNNIGSALKRLGQDEHAFAWYAAAIQIKPVYWTYYNLAILYRDRGQNRDAQWALEQALRLNPQFAEARDLSGRIQESIAKEPTPAAMENIKDPILAPAQGEIVDSRPDTTAAPETVTVKPQIAPARKPKPEKLLTRPPTVVKPRIPAAEVPLQLPADSGGQVFLTFDGGATDAGFDSILASLGRYKIKCTFFLTGQFVRNYPEKARRLLAEGHEIGNHSMNHPDMKHFGREKIARELEATEQVFVEVLGQRGAPFFRFPFGAQNKTVEKIVEDLGYRPVYWHIDTIDWREDPVATIIKRVDKKLRRNAVVLMHLGSKNGARALDQILQIVTSKGYTPARLSDLDASQLAGLP